jgi:hypothetical protein
MLPLMAAYCVDPDAPVPRQVRASKHSDSMLVSIDTSQATAEEQGAKSDAPKTNQLEAALNSSREAIRNGLPESEGHANTVEHGHAGIAHGHVFTTTGLGAMVCAALLTGVAIGSACARR